MKVDILSIKNLIYDTIHKSCIGHLYETTHTNQKYQIMDILEDIIYVLKTGISWRNLRSHINWVTLYWHYKRFVKYGIFKKTYLSLLHGCNKFTNIHIIDSTFIPNKFGKNKIARNIFYKSKNGNKISLVTDSNGIPLSIILKPGNIHDINFVNDHIHDMLYISKKYTSKNKKYMLADKGYVSENIRSALNLNGYTTYIPDKKNCKINHVFDNNMYKLRLKIEHTFARLKLFRRIMNRYDSLLKNYSEFLYLAMIFIFLENVSI